MFIPIVNCSNRAGRPVHQRPDLGDPQAVRRGVQYGHSGGEGDVARPPSEHFHNAARSEEEDDERTVAIGCVVNCGWQI